MSTNHPHAHSGEPVEQDAVSFSGIGWFVVILVGTTVACQLIVWGLFEFSAWRVGRNEAPRSVMAAPSTNPVIENGVISTGADAPPRPALLVQEPTVLREYQARHREMQQTYGWVDQTMGTIRLPIDRAKDLVLERGLPSRPAPAPMATAQPAAAPAGTPAPAPAPATPASTH